MATEVETEIKTRGSGLARVGTITTIIAAIIAAIPLGYTFYAQAGGSVQLTTLDQVKSLATNGTVLTIAGGAVALISLILGIIAVILAAKLARIIIAFISLVVLVAIVAFGVLYLQPRINDLNTLSNNVYPFATSIQDNCGTPLSTTTSDLTDALNHTQGAADDAAFAAAMQVAVPKLQADAATLATASNKLANLSVPDPKYQALYKDCVSSVKAELAFLTNSSAIPLPAPYNKLLPSVSGIDLLKNSAALATGQVPGLTVPAGTIEPLVAYALQQAVFAPSNLGAEGDALKADIRARLIKDCSPFSVDANNIVN
jgi:hypothetical protein